MTTKIRGEVWFEWGELPGSSTNQPAYIFSTGSFGSDKPFDVDAASPFVDLKHGNGEHTLIFSVQSNGTNVEQAHFPELTSGVAYHAFGALEVNFPVTGKFLYQVVDGAASYNSGTQKIRLTLRCAGVKAA